MNAKFDIQAIEKILKDAVMAGNVSQNVFEGERPSNLSTSLNDFVVVSVPSAITDLMAFANTRCRIEMFAKNNQNGSKNGKKLSSMYTKLCDIFPIDSRAYIFNINPTIIPLGNDGNGFHVHAIQIQTIIKSV